MRNSFTLSLFIVFFSIATITAQAADLLETESPFERPGSQASEKSLNDKESPAEERPPASESAQEQPKATKPAEPSGQATTKTEKKRIRRTKSLKKAPSAPDSSQQTDDAKTAGENSDVKRVEKWLEENEAAEKTKQAKKVREPIKERAQTAKEPTQTVKEPTQTIIKKPAQSFTVYLSPEPQENKSESKPPEKKSPPILNPPAKPPVPQAAKVLKPPPPPEMSKEDKLAEELLKIQSDLKAAESGDPEAQLRVGIKLYQGQGVLQDRKKGFAWILNAADEGKFSPESLHILGQAYFKGKDVEKNYVEARKWLSLLAEQDHYGAKNDLAFMLYNGLGGEKDYAKAFELFQQASRHGDVFAQANLGVMYATGTGTEMDKARAYAWYSFAASQGNKTAAQYQRDLLKDMSWEELNAAQRIMVELVNEVEKPKVGSGLIEPMKLKPRPAPSEKE